jgi:hypothetical protein
VCQGDVDLAGGSRAGSVQALSSGFTIAEAMPPLKVFISYSSVDLSTAELLYGDLRAAGAEPFEFGQSAKGDAAAFSEIIRWISTCDAFVVLISASSLDSFPVQEEIRTANHRYINSRRTHPAKIISAIIEEGAEPPLDIERFSRIELLDYAAGRATLFRQLGLQLPAPALVSPTPLFEPFDLDKLAREHARSRPREQSNWFERASTLLENYKDLKPIELPKEDEAQHVDSLLASLSGSAPGEFADRKQVKPIETAFLGVESSEPVQLSNRLIGFDPSKRQVPLKAPRLHDDHGTLRWTPVLGATGYVVERVVDGLNAEEVYRGTDTSYRVGSLVRMYLAASYRVKATGGVFREDSPWSDPVRFDAPKPRLGSLLTWELPPAPPTLELGTLFGTGLSWSAVDGATGYILERTLRPLLNIGDNWKQVYDGNSTTYLDFDRFGETGSRYGYRVKARGAWGETGWSDEVEG